MGPRCRARRDKARPKAGIGSFVFPADEFPHGPVHVRIYTNNQDKTRKDYREIQLYNTGGVVWNQGLPGRPHHRRRRR